MSASATVMPSSAASFAWSLVSMTPLEGDRDELLLLL